MAWQVELSSLARKNLDELDPQHARRLLAFLHERVSALDDPRSMGEALRSSRLWAFWKYRLGDYRVITNIEDGALHILIVRIGNRREVYR